MRTLSTSPRQGARLEGLDGAAPDLPSRVAIAESTRAPSSAPGLRRRATTRQRIGRYTLCAEIASGGMATVHLGRLLGPAGFARTVAIKRLHPPFAKDPEFVASFLDEARLAARIRHPNVVPTLDVVAIGGELFVVMEFVLGESLAELSRHSQSRGDVVPAAIAAAIVSGALHGLHAAHEARDEVGELLGIVHRDVSPHNILVGADGAPHLIDFGVAKARGRAQVTREGQIKGKLAYMPPEQLMGSTLDRRADVFAASIVLWETLTGRRLFQGVDDRDTFARVLHGEIEPPSRWSPGLPPALDKILLRGLARERSKRFATARDMALAIESAVPLASASQIAAWLDESAREALAERAALLEEVEREPPSVVAVAAFVRGALAAAASGVRGRAVRFGGPALAVAAAVAAAAYPVRLRLRSHELADVGAPDIVTADVQPVVRSPSLPPAPRFATQDETTGQAERRPASRDRSAGDRPSRRAATPAASPPRPGAAGGRASELRAVEAPPDATAASVRRAPSVAMPPAPGTTSCDPPFWYDAEGTKRYYRNCAGR